MGHIYYQGFLAYRSSLLLAPLSRISSNHENVIMAEEQQSTTGTSQPSTLRVPERDRDGDERMAEPEHIMSTTRPGGSRPIKIYSFVGDKLKRGKR